MITNFWCLCVCAWGGGRGHSWSISYQVTASTGPDNIGLRGDGDETQKWQKEGSFGIAKGTSFCSWVHLRVSEWTGKHKKSSLMTFKFDDTSHIKHPAHTQIVPYLGCTIRIIFRTSYSSWTLVLCCEVSWIETRVRSIPLPTGLMEGLIVHSIPDQPDLSEREEKKFNNSGQYRGLLQISNYGKAGSTKNVWESPIMRIWSIL